MAWAAHASGSALPASTLNLSSTHKQLWSPASWHSARDDLSAACPARLTAKCPVCTIAACPPCAVHRPHRSVPSVRSRSASAIALSLDSSCSAAQCGIKWPCGSMPSIQALWSKPECACQDHTTSRVFTTESQCPAKWHAEPVHLQSLHPACLMGRLFMQAVPQLCRQPLTQQVQASPQMQVPVRPAQ